LQHFLGLPLEILGLLLVPLLLLLVILDHLVFELSLSLYLLVVALLLLRFNQSPLLLDLPVQLPLKLGYLLVMLRLQLAIQGAHLLGAVAMELHLSLSQVRSDRLLERVDPLVLLVLELPFEVLEFAVAVPLELHFQVGEVGEHFLCLQNALLVPDVVRVVIP
jgi:hypothetical protein